MQAFPRIAYLLITGRCNLDCIGCYATLLNVGRHTKRGELTITQYKKIIYELVKIGVKIFDISGGEPLLRRDLLDICKCIKSYKDTIIWLVSNGTLTTQTRLTQLIPLIDRFAISLDSADPTVHDKLRGKPGSFIKSLDTLRKIKEIGVTESTVNFLLCSENYHCIGALIDLCLSEKIDRLSILSYRDVSEKIVNPESIPPMLALKQSWRIVLEKLNSNTWPLKVELVVPSFLHKEASLFWRNLSVSLRKRIDVLYPHLRGQMAFKERVVVKPFGTLTGDTAMINSDFFEIGSAIENNVSSLWKTNASMWRRRLLKRESILKETNPCNSCSRWNVCRGGCAAAALNQWNDYLKYDRSCDQFRKAGVF